MEKNVGDSIHVAFFLCCVEMKKKVKRELSAALRIHLTLLFGLVQVWAPSLFFFFFFKLANQFNLNNLHLQG